MQRETYTNIPTGERKPILEGKTPTQPMFLRDKKEMQMPFGKYAGYELTEIPKDYLKWISENLDLYGELRTAVFDELVGKFGEKLKSNQLPRV